MKLCYDLNCHQQDRIRSRPCTAFVTGASGFVGSFLVARLLENGWNVVGLARGADAMGRVISALRNARGFSAQYGKELRVVSGDIRDPTMGLPDMQAEELAKEVDAVWHCAAKFVAGGGGGTPFDVNVTGTRHLLEFARRCNRHRRVPFYYVSTAFAGDCRGGLVTEEAPSDDVSGRNAYECSKREAERMVLDWQRKYTFPAAIFRPSIIVGHSLTGRAGGFTAYYDCVRSLRIVARAQRSGKADSVLRVKSHPELRLNFVPIDFVIDAMCALAKSHLEGSAIFNIINDVPTSVGEVLKNMCHSFGLSGIVLADEGMFATRPMTKRERLFHAMIGFERPYLEREVLFDNNRFRRVVPADVLPAPRIDGPLLRRINRSYRDHCEGEAIDSMESRQSIADAGLASSFAVAHG